ncbi:DUF6944 family repetitive protein [Bacillus sp. 2205SS5-2]|uniref:DUF6944 family repetitive protein n=1 Tax=Bacillus sp. 2205SS5-2 TaxID=3109031 RepID=UPI0030065529
MEVYGDLLLVTGGWIQTFGTVVSASGETLIAKEEGESIEKLALKLVLLGNGMEAFGNSLQAIGLQKGRDVSQGKSLGILGSWLQAAGNSTNVVAAGLQINDLEEDGLKLDILGDSIQSIGAAFEAVSASMSDSEFAQIQAYGNTLLSLGAAIEGIGETFVLRKQKKIGEQIQALGSYAEAAGATLSAIALTKEFENKHHRSPQRNKNNNHPFSFGSIKDLY